MTTYATRNDLNRVFGKDNIDRWADPENSGSDPAWITERINWACEIGSANFEGRLAEGPYAIPIEMDGNNDYPPMVVLIVASIAGVTLYDTRRVADSDGNDQVAQQRKNFELFIRQIMRGQLKLTFKDGTKLDKTAQNSPAVATE